MRRANAEIWYAVFWEAKEKFGPPGQWNRPQVSEWVRQRVNDLIGRAPADVKPFDGRARQMPEERDEMVSSEDGYR